MGLSISQPARHLARYPWLRAGLTALGYGLLYAAICTALNKFAFEDGWTILWPLNGLTIALLIMRPRSQWAVLLFGVEIGTGVGHWLDHNPLSVVLWYCALSLAEVVITALILPEFSSLAEWLGKPHVYRRFVASVLLGPGISGVLTALLFHHLQGRPYLITFDNWAAADALGIAATMPLILSIGSPELQRHLERGALLKTLGALGPAIGCATLALSVSRYPLLFLLFPVMLVVDTVLSFAGSALVMCTVCFLAVYIATHGHGPFGVWPRSLPLSRDVALQLFLAFHIVALFPASLRILDRQRFAKELREANVQLTLLASLDGLTAIANRRALDTRFAQEWNRTLRAGAPLSMLMIDIDHFKQFNDRYGHQAGDQALIKVAAILAERMRRPADMVARFGGEEFAALLPDTELAGATHMAEHLREAVAALAIVHEGSSKGYVTVSIGCAAYSPVERPTGPDRFQLLKRADQALYRAKQAGRNRVETAERL